MYTLLYSHRQYRILVVSVGVFSRGPGGGSLYIGEVECWKPHAPARAENFPHLEPLTMNAARCHMVRTSNAERIRKYKAKMHCAGFKRLNIWAHSELLAMIRQHRRGNECYGRTLERLCLGEAQKRPRG